MAQSPESVDTARGITTEEARRRLIRLGPNELPPPPRDPWPVRLLRQFREPMALLLIGAAAVSGLGLQETRDAVAIVAIVLLNGLIGFVQEGRATHALDALRAMESPEARVVRDGRVQIVPSSEVVPGDLVLLSAGDRVPADLRLIEAASLEVDESVLTGESLPVEKDPRAVVPGDAPLAEQRSTAFSGTLVTRGSGRGVVVATGPETAIGRIAERLGERRPQTPLQEELGRLTARLGTIAVVVAVGVFGLTLVRTGVDAQGLERSFLAAVALAVAAVPEGLATVVTVGLALGVRRMAARGAIVRQLPAVETLGSTEVILTDKTGTLTENRMRVASIVQPGSSPRRVADVSDGALKALVEVAVLCNDATGDPPAGDPLEVALLGMADGEQVERLRARHPRLATLPFEADRRRMTTLHPSADGAIVLMKGAPEAVLERCSWGRTEGGRTVPLEEPQRRPLMDDASDLASRGMRVLALARRDLDAPPQDLEAAERDLTLVGMVGLRDPVRPEARAAVEQARSAGITIVMVTGDHPGTAAAIASEVGLIGPGARVLSGADLRKEGIPADPVAANVYGRVDPEQKLDLVEAVRATGRVVAVTGDGVNDAPALRRADIGVAMGRAGSDVAREASDLIVTDDNLATVVAAVREGRGIYDNVRKVVDYLVAGNLSEVIVVVVALLLFPSLGVPLLPLQLLWVNLLTDGLPALALGVDPVDPGLMDRPPRPRSERLLGGSKLLLLSVRGLVMGGAALGSLAVARFAWEEPWPHSRAIMFTVLVTAHLLYAFVARLPGRGVNRWLIGAVVAGLVLQLVVMAWPPAQPVFHTASLTVREWVLVVVAGTFPVAGMLLAERRRTGWGAGRR